MRIVFVTRLLLLLVGLGGILPGILLVRPVQVFVLGGEGGCSLSLYHGDCEGDAAVSAPTWSLQSALQALNLLGASPER